MATRYTLTSGLSCSGIATIAAEIHATSITLGGDSDVVNDTQDIGLTSEPIVLGEIAAGDAVAVEIVNLDDTNFISVGFANPVVAGTLTFKIVAGASGVFPTPSAGLYAIADTAEVKILKRAIELT